MDWDTIFAILNNMEYFNDVKTRADKEEITYNAIGHENTGMYRSEKSESKEDIAELVGLAAVPTYSMESPFYSISWRVLPSHMFKRRPVYLS